MSANVLLSQMVGRWAQYNGMEVEEAVGLLDEMRVTDDGEYSIRIVEDGVPYLVTCFPIPDDQEAVRN